MPEYTKAYERLVRIQRMIAFDLDLDESNADSTYHRAWVPRSTLFVAVGARFVPRTVLGIGKESASDSRPLQLC